MTPHLPPSTPSAGSPQSVPEQRRRGRIVLPPWILRLGNAYLKVLGAVISAILLNALLILLGLGGLGTNYLTPLLARYPLQAIAIAMALIVFAILSFVASGVLARDERDVHDSGGGASAAPLFTTWQQRVVVVSLGLGTLSVLLTGGLTWTVAVRPQWCYDHLSWACPGPQVLAGSAHDNNLEVHLVTTQQASVVLTADPSQYTLASLPTSSNAIPAVQVAPHSQQTGITELGTSSFRVVLSVHSLEHGSYGLRITKIALYVTSLPPQPYPLNVWIQGPTFSYQTEPYRVVYNGQPIGAQMLARFVGSPTAYTHLVPGESDTLTIQVDSSVPTNLQFRLAVSYRLDNANVEGTVMLPKTFEVAFGDKSNWHPYHLQNGHLVAG